MRHYDDDILVFYAKEKHYFTDWNKGVIFKKMVVSEEKKYAWTKYVRSAKVYEVKGEHSTIFDANNAEEFARIMQQHLDESHLISHEYEIRPHKIA
jgi:thioesterase domain-containing protein